MSSFLQSSQRQRRVCPICKHTKWHRTSDGKLVCPLGHEYQGYIQEELEYSGVPTIARKKAKKDIQTKSVQKYFSKRGDYLYVKCLQLLLQSQVSILITKFNVPKQLEQIVKQLWLLRLSDIDLIRYKDDDLELHGDIGFESSSDSQNDDKSSNLSDFVSEFKQDISNHSDAGFSDFDYFDNTQNNFSSSKSPNKSVNNSPLNSNTLGKNLHNLEPFDSINKNISNDDTLASSTNINSFIQNKKLDKKRTKYQFLRIPRRVYSTGIFTDTGKLGVNWTAVICFLGLMWIRHPILFSDFYRLIIEEEIPYLSVLKVIPRSWRIRLSSNHLSMLSKIGIPNVEKFRHTITLFTQMYYKKYRLKFPITNPNLMIFSLVKRINLPIQVFNLVQKAFVLINPFEKIVFTSFKNSTNESALSNTEKLIAATFVVVLKIIYGLDGIRRHQHDIQTFIDKFGSSTLKMPTENEFIDFLRFDFLSQFSTNEFSELGTFNNSSLEKYIQTKKAWLLLDGSSKRIRQRSRFEQQLSSMFTEIKGLNDWNDNYDNNYLYDFTKDKSTQLANRYYSNVSNSSDKNHNTSSTSNLCYFNRVYTQNSLSCDNSTKNPAATKQKSKADSNLFQFLALDSQIDADSDYEQISNNNSLNKDKSHFFLELNKLPESQNKELDYSFMVPETIDSAISQQSIPDMPISTSSIAPQSINSLFDDSVKNGMIPSVFHQNIGIDLLTDTQKMFFSDSELLAENKNDPALKSNTLYSGDMIPSYLINYENELTLDSFGDFLEMSELDGGVEELLLKLPSTNIPKSP
ncbi:hypothetical protein BB561_004835 [Smittium simulii]|uniref:RRN7-type domain-containing protein n=1 Tax=Smittium simulii TaxID=133385 RepID=A0A2T9YDW0_9FUNG|nr:hypothetical protein BB561_004835 [Smittium simulii]